MCESWKTSFSEFLSYMGRCPDGFTLDRIDNDGNYEPGNCRWLSIEDQQLNRSNNIKITSNGVTKTPREWSACTGMKYHTILQRFHSGMDHNEIFSTPIQKRNGYLIVAPNGEISETLTSAKWAKAHEQ